MVCIYTTRPCKGITETLMGLKQSLTPIEKLSQRHRLFAELLAEGNRPKVDCMVASGFARSSEPLIGPSRDRSKFPALWDYYQQLRNEKLRLYEVTQKSISDELRIIAFSKITDFVAIPDKRSLARQALFDAQMRKQMGYTDPEDEQLLADKIQFREELSENATERLQRYAPGAAVKLRCLEDIPAELLPAIASLKETRDGIEIKLWNKLDALDKLARILKLYDNDDARDKPTTIENLNLIVNGTKSDLLERLKDI